MKALRLMVLASLAACGGNGAHSDTGAKGPEKSAPPPAVTAPLKILPVLPASDGTPTSPRPDPVTASPAKASAPQEASVATPPATPTPPPAKPEPTSCEDQGRVTDEDGRSCRDKRFADYCRSGVEIDEEEQLTVSRILNGLHLSDCIEVERYLERQPTLILPANGQKIADLRPIGTLKMLRVLHVANNRIVDISPLSALSQLEVLNVRSNAISDLSPLSSLSKLRRVDVSGNDARDLSVLTKMPHLTRIQAGPVSDPIAIEKREPITMRDVSTGTLE